MNLKDIINFARCTFSEAREIAKEERASGDTSTSVDDGDALSEFRPPVATLVRNGGMDQYPQYFDVYNV